MKIVIFSQINKKITEQAAFSLKVAPRFLKALIVEAVQEQRPLILEEEYPPFYRPRH